MKINVIQDLVEKYSAQTIQKLTDQLEKGQPLSHPVEGDSENEQLSHLVSAGWIHEQMKKNHSDFQTEANRLITRIRDSVNRVRYS